MNHDLSGVIVLLDTAIERLQALKQELNDSLSTTYDEAVCITGEEGEDIDLENTVT